MRKNVASQVVGAQMVSASDGSAFTGSVTVYVTGNGGTQAVGSVGSGACTHEGNGFHTYAPAQAETNYDHVAFTFVGTGAVPATVQVYPSFPQTGDTFARVGAPVGASISADIAGVQADTDNIQTRIPAALVSGRMDASVGAMATDVLTATALDATAVTEIQSGLSTLNAAGVRTAIGLASANLDTQLGAIAGYIDTEVAAILAAVDTEVGAIKAVTDRLDTALELDVSVYRFTVNALEQAPAGGGGGSTDWTADERTAIRAILGIPGSGTTPADPTTGILDTVRDLVTTGITYIDTEVAAIKAKTDNLPSDPADASDIAASFTTVNGTLATITGYLDTEIAAIKAKTDNLPAAPAAVSDIPTALQNADALLKRDMSAVTGEAARSPLNAFRFLRNKWGIAGATLTVTKEDDTTSAWTATVTAAPGADPISGSDPA
jgi:hypothetical protein